MFGRYNITDVMDAADRTASYVDDRAQKPASVTPLRLRDSQ